jgi:hypothetical protein
MITMITIAPKLMNMGCSSDVWGLMTRVPAPAEPGWMAGPGSRDDVGYGVSHSAGAGGLGGTAAAWPARGSGCAVLSSPGVPAV